jgi:hypothetical protein
MNEQRLLARSVVPVEAQSVLENGVQRIPASEPGNREAGRVRVSSGARQHA